MARLAKNTSAFCNPSGLVTEAGAGWSPADLKRYVDHLVDVFFTPTRLIWGSDWPVVNLAGSYGAWFAAANELLRDLSGDVLAGVMGGNAARAFRIIAARVPVH